MTLARRLLTGTLLVVVTLISAVVLIAGGRLHGRLVLEKTDELSRAARLVAIGQGDVLGTVGYAL